MSDSMTIGGTLDVPPIANPDHDTPGGPIPMRNGVDELGGATFHDSESEIEALAEASTNAPERKPRVYDEDQNLVVEVSPGKIVKMRELDGFQSIKADSMISSAPNPMIIVKVYALFAIVSLSVNGQHISLPPTKDDQQVYRRAAMLSARELFVLMDAYADAFMGDPMAGEELKKS